jgi:hypothetical protein
MISSLNKTALTAGALCLSATMALSDQVFQDNLIIKESVCIGMDCANGESFGFDTLRLKENNLRIRAVDTSNSSSFPTADWQITFNDSSNGGANKFSIDDIDGSKTPFTIIQGARSNSIYVASSGHVGMGTSNPAVNAHIVHGNTPTLRLEQDGSSGFGAQTWDVAGNEANFFIRDATNSSQLPFRIKPGTPTDTLALSADGHVGIGTLTPQDDLHIKDAGSAAIRLEATGSNADNPVRINLNGNNDELRITWDGLGLNQLKLDETGKMSIIGAMETGSKCLQMETLACTFADGAGASCVVGSCP